VDLTALYGGAFINWEAVEGSWAKRTVSSRLVLFAARRYLESAPPPDPEREALISGASLPGEVRWAFASPPSVDEAAGPGRLWGEFVDAALAAELEMVSYGERPPVLGELKSGLRQAAEEADGELARWFLDRRGALPGSDLPDDAGYQPF
jgi:hypothetical protein